MKRFFNYIICLAALFTLFSCAYFQDEDDQNNTPETNVIVENFLSADIKKKIVEQDSLMNDLVKQVGTLTTVLIETKKENAELKERIEDFESPRNKWAYISLTAFVIAFISLISALWRAREKRINGLIKQYLDNSDRINGLLTNVNSLLLKSSSNSTPKVSTRDIENDIKLLKMQIKQIVNDVNAINYANKKQHETPVNHEQPKPVEPPYHKVGYAKVDTDMYFTTIFDSNQEGCVFKITFTSPTKGKFNIISLDKIQSRNDWQKKVECSGISIKDATDYHVEDDGICEKIDENTWEVKTPLKIRLIK